MKKGKGFFWRLQDNRGFVGPNDQEDDADDDDEIVIDDDVTPPAVTPPAKDVDDVDDDDVTPNADGSLTIDLEEKKRAANSAFAKMRAENKRLKEENERIQRQAQMSQYTPPAPVVHQPVDDGRPKFRGMTIPNTDAEWDELARKNWRVAVDMRAHMQSQEIVRQSAQISQDNTVLETSKSKVLNRHPELNDSASEKTQIYLKILNENPKYLTDPKGPVHAMRDMEEYMQDVLGYKPDEITKARKEGAATERQRQSRVDLASSTGRSTLPSGNTVTVSKDELEFCKYHGIDPKDFAKNKKKLTKSGGTGGIQV